MFVYRGRRLLKDLRIVYMSIGRDMHRVPKKTSIPTCGFAARDSRVEDKHMIDTVAGVSIEDEWWIGRVEGMYLYSFFSLGWLGSRCGWTMWEVDRA